MMHLSSAHIFNKYSKTIVISHYHNAINMFFKVDALNVTELGELDVDVMTNCT